MGRGARREREGRVKRWEARNTTSGRVVWVRAQRWVEDGGGEERWRLWRRSRRRRSDISPSPVTRLMLSQVCAEPVDSLSCPPPPRAPSPPLDAPPKEGKETQARPPRCTPRYAGRPFVIRYQPNRRRRRSTRGRARGTRASRLIRLLVVPGDHGARGSMVARRRHPSFQWYQVPAWHDRAAKGARSLGSAIWQRAIHPSW